MPIDTFEIATREIDELLAGEDDIEIVLKRDGMRQAVARELLAEYFDEEGV